MNSCTSKKCLFLYRTRAIPPKTPPAEGEHVGRSDRTQEDTLSVEQQLLPLLWAPRPPTRLQPPSPPAHAPAACPNKGGSHPPASYLSPPFPLSSTLLGI